MNIKRVLSPYLVMLALFFWAAGETSIASAATLIPGAAIFQSSDVPSADTRIAEQLGTTKEKEKSKEKTHTGSFVAAPIPMVSPALGTGIVPVVGYITPIPATDRAITPSILGVGGLITNDGSRGFVLISDLYLEQARYEWETFYAHGNLDYSLYGVGAANGNAGLKLPLEQTGQLMFTKLLRNVGHKIYVGGRFINGTSFITLKPTTGNAPEIPPDVGLHTNLRALGIEVSRDSRPNRFYPLTGSMIDFTGDFFAQALGSKYSYQSYKLTYSKYASIGKNQVLAYNFFYCGTDGSPPFYGDCIYGSNNELRGYTAGRYLDRQMYATQIEYRLVLPKKFGLVAFGGSGSVFPGADQIFRRNAFLPAGGTGLRYTLSKAYHVNLRTDFAWGKDNFTWGLGVGEAF